MSNTANNVKKKSFDIFLAFLFTLAVPTIGYLSFGIWPSLIFLTGYLVGFILWLIVPAKTSFTAIKVPYLVTLGFFLLHRIDEYLSDFQVALSDLTGVPVPDVASLPIMMLLVGSIGVWIIFPLLMKRGYSFGYYLAWTFFASMGFGELAHFIFPIVREGPYGYFPAMITVVLLAPAAWFGMWRLAGGGSILEKE